MIIVAASALVGILLEESDAQELKGKLERADSAAMSPINLWEAIVRLRSVAGEEAVATLEGMLAELQVEFPSIGATEARAAADAYARYGRQSPAGLNLGDCFAYALAKARGAPLLYKGNDLSKTDIAAA